MAGPLKNGNTRGGKIEAVEDLLDAVFHTPEAKEHLAKYRVFSNWRGIVGDGIAAQTTPLKVRGSQLLVEVPSAVWMNELHLRTPMILAKIEKMYPESNIESIRFYHEKESSKEKRERLYVTDKRRLDVKLDKSDIDQITDVIDDVEDDALREALWQLFYLNAQHNKGGSK